MSVLNFNYTRRKSPLIYVAFPSRQSCDVQVFHLHRYRESRLSREEIEIGLSISPDRGHALVHCALVAINCDCYVGCFH